MKTKIKGFCKRYRSNIFFGISLLIVLTGTLKLSYHFVMGEVNDHKEFVIAKDLPTPKSTIIDLSEFDGIVKHKSEVEIIGAIIDMKVEGLDHFKEILGNANSESILIYSHYGYNGGVSNGEESSSQGSEYVLELTLFSVDDVSCNRYERYCYNEVFYYHIGDYVYGLADKISVNSNSIRIDVRKSVRGLGFWFMLVLYSLLKSLVIFGLVCFWLWLFKEFKKDLVINKAKKNLEN